MIVYTAEDLYRAILSWGYRDVVRACDTVSEAEQDIGKFGEFVEQWCDDLGSSLGGIDIVAAAYEFIAVQAGVPELQVNGNYCCTDYSSSGAEKKLLAVPEDERNDAWRWVADQCGVEVPEQPEEEYVWIPLAGQDEQDSDEQIALRSSAH